MKKFLFILLVATTLVESCGNNQTEVQIGTQQWMEKNLNVLTYRNGDIIPQVTDASTWGVLTTGAWCYYDNDPKNEAIYGKLYNWYAVNDPRGLAPSGWHIPTDAEWTILINTLGGESLAGGKMKTTDTTSWTSPNMYATNESGFAGLPGGNRSWNGWAEEVGGDNSSNYGAFASVGNYGFWWSATQGNSANAWYRYLYYDGGGVDRGNYYKYYGFSVRCLRD